MKNPVPRYAALGPSIALLLAVVAKSEEQDHNAPGFFHLQDRPWPTKERIDPQDCPWSGNKTSSGVNRRAILTRGQNWAPIDT
jgi:hypothetical protein